MQSFSATTGLTAFDVLLIFAYAFSLMLLIEPVWNRGAPALPTALVVLCGAGFFAFLLVRYHKETSHIIGVATWRAADIGVVLALLAIAAALRDLLLVRCRGLGAATLDRLGVSLRTAAPVATGAILVVVAVVGALGLVWLNDNLESGYAASLVTSAGGGAAVRTRHVLAGHPMDIAFRGARDGYVSLGEGEIDRFTLTEGNGIELETVASGLDFPRGLAIVDDTLVVTELGPLPCKPSFPSCKGEEVPGAELIEGEREILRSSRGRILAFDIQADGTLGPERTLLADLPVANTDHGVNGLTVGPDGRLYVAIGNVDRLYATPDVGEEVGHPNADYLGTVLALDVEGGPPEVFAHGLRNVYDLAFDADGRLFGTDNDGLTTSGWRREELLEIHKGGYYGYPYDGTFEPYVVPRDPPLWVVDQVGSAGIEWIPASGSETGSRLLVGSCGELDSVGLSEADGRVFVADRAAYTSLLDLPGCVTSLERADDGTVLMAVWAFTGDSELDVVTLAS